MSPTRALVLAAAVSTAAALAAYAAFRLLGADASAASLRTCIFAGIAFLLGSTAIRIKAGAFSQVASAGIVAAGAGWIGVLFAASSTANQFGLLLGGFVFGIALAVFALMKDLDMASSPKLLLFVPMAQMVTFLIVFGH